MLLVANNIDAWSTSGAAKTLTSSYVAGTAFKTRCANTLNLALESAISGTSMTSLDIALEWSPDGGTTYFVFDAINSVVAGVVDEDDARWAMPGSGGYHTLKASIPPGIQMRVKAKRTGGDAGCDLIATATLTVE